MPIHTQPKFDNINVCQEYRSYTSVTHISCSKKAMSEEGFLSVNRDTSTCVAVVR